MIINKIKFIKKGIWSICEAIFNKKKIKFDNSKKYAFIMLYPDYDNLGDIAIGQAQYEYLKNNLKDYQIIKVPIKDTYKVYFSIKKNIKKDSIITLIGGGNNGSLYEFIEQPRRFILKHFRKHKIISFPQSVFYEDKKEVIDFKNKFIKLCNRCSDLTLIAREQSSYNIYKSMFKDKTSIKIILRPDIVFSLNIDSSIYDRKDILFILRDDKEKLINNELEENILDYVKSKNIKYEFRDTCNLKYNLKEFIELIKNKKIVITDRLHGMIFCYITNTPCIVLENNNHKIISTYNTWLKNQNFIKLYNKKTFEQNFDELYSLLDIYKEKLLNFFDIKTN